MYGLSRSPNFLLLNPESTEKLSQLRVSQEIIFSLTSLTCRAGPSSNIGGGGGGGEGKASSGAGGKGSSKGGGGGGKAQFEEKLSSSPGGGGGGSGSSSAVTDTGISPTLPIWARWAPVPGGCGCDDSDVPPVLKGFTLGLGATTGANFFCGL